MNRLVPVNNLGWLRRCTGCRYFRDYDAGTLTISQQDFAENIALMFGVRSGRKRLLRASNSKSKMSMNRGDKLEFPSA